MPNYSLCESVTASPVSRNHIRKLTAKGRMLSGGADTAALCGRAVSWDLATPLQKRRLPYICLTCCEIYEDQMKVKDAN